MLKILMVLFVSLLALNTYAGFILHGVELGVGKFHRMDNKNHPYPKSGAWVPYILADGLDPKNGFIQKNDDGSVSVFFTSLEELIQLSVKAAVEKGTTIDIFNVHGHGLPGGMWYPIDKSARDGLSCMQWRSNAFGSDSANYSTYYTSIPENEILAIRRMSNKPKAGGMPCVSNSDSWKTIIQRNPKFISVLSDEVQINFLSCVVGLGVAGENFAATISGLLQKSSKSKVLTSINFGLGDWSLPEGMAFWDYLNKEQLDDFNRKYPVQQKDRDFMISGTVRETVLNASSTESKLYSQVAFLEVNKPFSGLFLVQRSVNTMPLIDSFEQNDGGYFRIPHTNEFIILK